MYSAGAAITGVIATIFLVAILISPGGWKWWSAAEVHGVEHAGVVSYNYRGQTYSLDDVTSTSDGNRTVYLNPANPSESTLSIEGAQISDSAVTGGLYLGSAIFFLMILRRRKVRARRHANPAPGRFGDGIDSETVRRIVASRAPRS